jgi:hypothetical protein
MCVLEFKISRCWETRYAMLFSSDKWTPVMCAVVAFRQYCILCRGIMLESDISPEVWAVVYLTKPVPWSPPAATVCPAFVNTLAVLWSAGGGGGECCWVVVRGTGPLNESFLPVVLKARAILYLQKQTSAAIITRAIDNPIQIG